MGAMWDAGYQTQVGSVQGKHLTCCAIFMASIDGQINHVPPRDSELKFHIYKWDLSYALLVCCGYLADKPGFS